MIEENVVTEAVARYGRERDRYLKLASLVSDICRNEIVEANVIRAQITSRAKSMNSLEGKLKRFSRRDDKCYHTVDDVFVGIGDLAGVRVTTYQPSDIERVMKGVATRFGIRQEDIEEKDNMGGGVGFYRAIHCSVELQERDLVGTYQNLTDTKCEIQICSMMAHVWNEIEHDIVYKPQAGGAEQSEKSLLQALGHLSRSGDEIITRLLEANFARLKDKIGEFADEYDFVARFREKFPDANLPTHARQLFEEIERLKLNSREKLENAIGTNKFNQENANDIIHIFNSALPNNEQNDYALDNNSSDVILALLLENYAERIIQNNPAGRGVGRPRRISSIARRFRDHQ